MHTLKPDIAGAVSRGRRAVFARLLNYPAKHLLWVEEVRSPSQTRTKGERNLQHSE